MRINKDRVEFLRTLKSPTTVKELQRALGAFGYVQKWIPGLAEIAKPLNKAVALYNNQEKNEFQWSDEMETAFNSMKDRTATASAIQLKIPDFTRKFVLVTDASDSGTGAMLANEVPRERVLEPIAFFHHTLSSA